MRGKNRIGYGIGVMSLGLATLFGAPAVPALASWLGLMLSAGGVVVLAGLTLVAAGVVVYLRDRAAGATKPATEPEPPESGAQWNRDNPAPGVLTFTNTGRSAEVRFITPWSVASSVDTDFSLPIRIDSGDTITVRYDAPKPDRIKLHWRTFPGGSPESHSFRVPATRTPQADAS